MFKMFSAHPAQQIVQVGDKSRKVVAFQEGQGQAHVPRTESRREEEGEAGAGRGPGC